MLLFENENIVYFMENLSILIKSDLAKIRRTSSLKSFLSAVFFNSSFKRILLYRIRSTRNNKFSRVLWKVMEKLLSVHYSVYIYDAEIGPGLNLPHCFSIMISSCKIGQNVTIGQQVTIGSDRGGSKPGYPLIGNNVFIACGAKVIGNVKVGNNVIIGANAVVVNDIPDNAVVGGVPARVLNYNGESQVKNWVMDLNYYYK